MLMLKVHAPNVSSQALVFQKKKARIYDMMLIFCCQLFPWRLLLPTTGSRWDKYRQLLNDIGLNHAGLLIHRFFSNKYSQPLLSVGFPFLDSNNHWSKIVFLHSQPQIPNYGSKTLFWSVISWTHKCKGPTRVNHCRVNHSGQWP